MMVVVVVVTTVVTELEEAMRRRQESFGYAVDAHFTRGRRHVLKTTTPTVNGCPLDARLRVFIYT